MRTTHNSIKKPSPEQLMNGLDRHIKGRDNHFGVKPGKLVTDRDLAAILGVAVAELNRWRDEGCPCLPDPRGKGKYLYNSGNVLRWRFKTDMDAIAETVLKVEPELNDAMETREADRRYKVAKALREELELAKEQQLVANIDDLMLNFGIAASHVRATLMSWQSRLPGLLAHQDEKTIATSLDIEIENVLESLTNYQHGYKGLNVGR
tara:strand:- start:1261 stop:1881 length:621 start_codon:yes stop_codon:yes gene_type:complete